MKKYASCSKIREDTRAPEFMTGYLSRWSWSLRDGHGVAGSVLKMLPHRVEYRMRRLEAWMSCDDGRGVCLAEDFLKKIRKKFKISSLYPLIISTKKEGHDDQQHGLIA
jgi:hypothetical protein